MKNKLITSIVLVTTLWYLLLPILFGGNHEIHILAMTIPVSYLLLNAYIKVIVGIVVGSACAYVFFLLERGNTLQTIMPKENRYIASTIGDTPERATGKKLNRTKKVTTMKKFPKLANFAEHYQKKYAQHYDLLLALLQTMDAYPKIPASPVPGGHGGLSLLDHSINVLLVGLETKYAHVDFKNDSIYRLDDIDPIIPICLLGHDIGKITCYKIDNKSEKIIETNEKHDEVGAELIRNFPEIWNLADNDRLAIILTIGFYHHRHELVNWADERTKSVMEFLIEMDNKAGQLEEKNNWKKPEKEIKATSTEPVNAVPPSLPNQNRSDCANQDSNELLMQMPQFEADYDNLPPDFEDFEVMTAQQDAAQTMAPPLAPPTKAPKAEVPLAQKPESQAATSQKANHVTAKPTAPATSNPSGSKKTATKPQAQTGARTEIQNELPFQEEEITQQDALQRIDEIAGQPETSVVHKHEANYNAEEKIDYIYQQMEAEKAPSKAAKNTTNNQKVDQEVVYKEFLRILKAKGSFSKGTRIGFKHKEYVYIIIDKLKRQLGEDFNTMPGADDFFILNLENELVKRSAIFTLHQNGKYQHTVQTRAANGVSAYDLVVWILVVENYPNIDFGDDIPDEPSIIDMEDEDDAPNEASPEASAQSVQQEQSQPVGNQTEKKIVTLSEAEQAEQCWNEFVRILNLDNSFIDGPECIGVKYKGCVYVSTKKLEAHAEKKLVAEYGVKRFRKHIQDSLLTKNMIFYPDATNPHANYMAEISFNGTKESTKVYLLHEASFPGTKFGNEAQELPTLKKIANKPAKDEED